MRQSKRLICENKYFSDKVEVVPIPGKGLGIIAKQDFNKNELVEAAPIIEIPEKDNNLCAWTIFGKYWFSLTDQICCIGLGYTSIYNHANKPNASFYSADKVLLIKAIKKIKKGEEITVDYQWGKKDTKNFI